jgi:hypothetical protein
MAKRKVKVEETPVISANTMDETPDNGAFQNLVDFCIGKYEEFKGSTYRAAKIEEIEESRKAYEQKIEEKIFPWKNASNLIMPFTTIAVDNIEPRMVAGLVGTDPIVLFSVKGKKDEIIKVVENEFNQELKDVCKVEEFARHTVHQILTEGTYYCAPKYDQEKRTITDFVYEPVIKKDPKTGETLTGADGTPLVEIDQEGKPMTTDRVMISQDGKPLTKEEETTVFEGGKFEYIPFNDIYCADNLGTMEDWEREPVIRKIYPTYAELMRNRNKLGYSNIGKWLIGEKSDDKSSTDSEKLTSGQKLDDADITGKEVIESIEAHLSYPLPIDVEKEEDRETFEEEKLIVTIALKSEKIYRIVKQRDINFNNEKVIKRIRLYPELDRSYGTSIYGKIKSLQNGASDIFNHIMNESIIQMLSWFFYDERSGLKGKQEIFPGKGIPCENVEGIKFPEFRGDPGKLIVVFDSFVTFWERMTSMADPQIGRLADRKETATGILTAVQEGNIKHNYQATTIKEEFLACIRTMYDLYYKNMPYDKTILYEGQKVLYPRQAMRRQVKFSLTGSTEKANKLLSRKESEDLWTLFRADPLSNPIKLFEDILKNYGKDNPEEYIKPEVNQMVQAFAAFPELVQMVQKYVQGKMMEKEMGAGKKPLQTGGPREQPGMAA